jgi:hypothetical protein
MKKSGLHNGETAHSRLRFYAKCALVCLPFMLLLFFYVWNDPFKVLRDYDDYDHSEVCLDEGSMSWYKFRKLREKVHYDSFIMGTSCTMAYRCEDWNNYIKGRPYRFFGNADGIIDLYLKLDAVDRQPRQPIRNLLLIFDRSLLAKDYVQTGPVGVMPSAVSHESEVSYQMTFVQEFFDPRFLLPYLQYRMTHRFTDGMTGIINPNGQTRQGDANDEFLPNEQKIKEMGESYWQSKTFKNFSDNSQPIREAHPVIFNTQLTYLKKIKAICDKHHTNVKIVITPKNDRTVLNHRDVAIIENIFGKENVYNANYRCFFDKHSYYDGSHYRLFVGRRIINDIYGKKTK